LEVDVFVLDIKAKQFEAADPNDSAGRGDQALAFGTFFTATNIRQTLAAVFAISAQDQPPFP